MRPAGGLEHLRNWKKPSIRQIFAENRAEDGNDTLASQYAAVIAPYKTGASLLLSARLLADEPDTGVLAVEVKLLDRTDYIISTKDQQERQFGPSNRCRAICVCIGK